MSFLTDFLASEAFMYLMVSGLLLLFAVSWSFIGKKMDLQDKDIDFIKRVLDVVDYITKQFEFKYKDDISKIVMYTIEALDFVDQFDATTDPEIRFILVKDRAIYICEREGIDLGDGAIIEIVDRIVELLLKQEKLK